MSAHLPIGVRAIHLRSVPTTAILPATAFLAQNTVLSVSVATPLPALLKKPMVTATWSALVPHRRNVVAPRGSLSLRNLELL